MGVEREGDPPLLNIFRGLWSARVHGDRPGGGQVM